MGAHLGAIFGPWRGPHFHRPALKRAEKASITSRMGVHLGSILGPWRGPHFGRPSRASATGEPGREIDLAAADFGLCPDGRIWTPKFYFPKSTKFLFLIGI